MKRLAMWRAARLASAIAAALLTPAARLATRLAKLAQQAESHSEIQALYAQARVKTIAQLQLRNQKWPKLL